MTSRSLLLELTQCEKCRSSRWLSWVSKKIHCKFQCLETTNIQKTIFIWIITWLEKFLRKIMIRRSNFIQWILYSLSCKKHLSAKKKLKASKLCWKPRMHLSEFPWQRVQVYIIHTQVYVIWMPPRSPNCSHALLFTNINGRPGVPHKVLWTNQGHIPSH